MCIQPFILYRTPELFHKDVIQSLAFSIHADADFPILQRCQKIMTGKLAALICIEYFRFSMLQGTIQRMYIKVCIQCVRLPAGHVTAVPVNNGNQIHKPLGHRAISDVSTPHLTWSDNFYTSQQVWVKTLCSLFRRLVPNFGPAPCIPMSLISRFELSVPQRSQICGCPSFPSFFQVSPWVTLKSVGVQVSVHPSFSQVSQVSLTNLWVVQVSLNKSVGVKFLSQVSLIFGWFMSDQRLRTLIWRQ